MTIKYKGKIVIVERTIKAKGSFLGALLGGPRTFSLKLTPDTTDPYNDTVEINSSYGSYEVRGPSINSNPKCKEHEISWTKERFL